MVAAKMGLKRLTAQHQSSRDILFIETDKSLIHRMYLEYSKNKPQSIIIEFWQDGRIYDAPVVCTMTWM